MKRTFIAAALSATFIFSNAWAAVPNDFDGDGVSDLTRVGVADDGSLVWRASASASGAVTDLGAFGKEGDTPAVAQWLGEGTQIGIVAEGAEEESSLKWSIIDQNGTRTDKTFGEKGDVVVVGGDFNGNGTADAAVVRLVNGSAQWDISYDMFAASEPVTQQVSFGKTGDRVFFARIDETQVDWIGVIGKGKRGRSQARFRNLVTGEVRRFNRMPKLASTGSRPRPFAIRQASGPDHLGFQVTKGSSTTLSVFTISGTRLYSSALEGSGSIAVGDFNSGPGYEVAFQSDADNLVINPVVGEEREIEQIEGELVDENSIAVVGVDPSSGGSGGGNGNNGGGGSSGGGSVSQCSSIVGWPGGHIYKTIGSEHFYDVRRNTIGIVIKPGGRGPFPSCVDAIDTSGNVIAKLSLYERGNGWAARYYAGIGCGAGTPFNGASVAAKARANTGSSRVYMNFGGVCYGPIDAGTCIGSKQC
jgi:hypothetical protein